MFNLVSFPAPADVVAARRHADDLAALARSGAEVVQFAAAIVTALAIGAILLGASPPPRR